MVKFAVTDFAADMLTTQAPDPVQAPDHDEKTLPEAAVADRVTLAPFVKVAAQVDGQEMPAG